MQLTTNFSLSEFIKSPTANRLGIDNSPNDTHVEHLKYLCEKVLQPARDHFKSLYSDVFIKINSGYRNKELSEAVGSSTKSFHYYGMAADVELWIKNGNSYLEVNDKLYFYIKENLPFTELIWEYGNDLQPDWVHVAISKNDNRKMIKRFPKNLPLK